MRRFVSFSVLLSLLGLGIACRHSTAEEVEPIASLQGTWSIGTYTTYELGRDLKVVTQYDSPAYDDYVAITDSQMQFLVGKSQTALRPPFPYQRDGDTLRVQYTGSPPALAQCVTELTTHKLTLRWRRPHSIVVHYTAGDAYYELIEQHYSR
jgi:hypothetical protein